MKKIYRVLGKRGRITIPEDIRMIAGIGCNDILSFTIDTSHCITLQKVEVCDEEKKKACMDEKRLADLYKNLPPVKRLALLAELTSYERSGGDAKS